MYEVQIVFEQTLITFLLKPITPTKTIFSRRMLWSNVSNAFCRSTKIIPVCIPMSIPFEIKSVS